MLSCDKFQHNFKLYAIKMFPSMGKNKSCKLFIRL